MSTKRLAVALQGGGSHGAFTWGVIEALLQVEGLELEAFSGTSAGGMNAAAAVQGLIANGKAGAIECLRSIGAASTIWLGARLRFTSIR